VCVRAREASAGAARPVLCRANGVCLQIACDTLVRAARGGGGGGGGPRPPGPPRRGGGRAPAAQDTAAHAGGCSLRRGAVCAVAEWRAAAADRLIFCGASGFRGAQHGVQHTGARARVRAAHGSACSRQAHLRCPCMLCTAHVHASLSPLHSNVHGPHAGRALVRVHGMHAFIGHTAAGTMGSGVVSGVALVAGAPRALPSLNQALVIARPGKQMHAVAQECSRRRRHTRTVSRPTTRFIVVVCGTHTHKW
jgi:hypothetical protein